MSTTRYLDVTRSTCPSCRKLLPARVLARDGRVLLATHCPEHGWTEALVYSDEAAWLESQGYCKPGSKPFAHTTEARGCPDSCGLCPEHEQHVCMPIIEITDRCDLACPSCIVDNAHSHDMPFPVFRGIVEKLLENEGTVQVLNLSGGEPTLHPEYERFLEYLVAEERILRVSVSTNGSALLRRPELLDLHRRLDVVVSLQLDGFEPETYRKLRGRAELASAKRELLDRILAQELTASLTVTLARGVNEHELPGILDLYLAHDNLVSLMIQPFAHEGQGQAFPHDPLDRVTIPETIERLVAGSRGVLEKTDFGPLPCCHPACFWLTFLLKVDGGGWLPVRRVVPQQDYLDLIRNRSYVSPDGENLDRIRGLLYDLWSGPAALLPQSEGALRTIKSILAEVDATRPGPKQTVRIAERKMKSIFVHQFMDAETFDVSRVRRCCTVYAREDGRFYPMCSYNVLRRTPALLAKKP